MKNLVIFTEERSAAVMLKSLLPRLLPQLHSYRCIAFEGKQDLEQQIPIKLRAWRAPNTCFVVLRDQDNADCCQIKDKLVDICKKAKRPKTLVRIACRELESWYLADLAAVEKGLQMEGLRRLQQKAKYRQPDAMQNPADELKKITKFSYQKVGGSREIGKYLQLDNDRSKSFQVFIDGLKKLIGETAC